MAKEIEDLKGNGFVGFVKVSELRGNTRVIPDEPGVYVVIRDSVDAPEFLAVGTGGCYKGKNPNVSVDILERKYVPDSRIIYVGKASLRKSYKGLRWRIRELLRFGTGCKGHWGGRYLWQLADSTDLLVAWRTTPMDTPRDVEKTMLATFIGRHGRLPFANLRN